MQAMFILRSFTFLCRFFSQRLPAEPLLAEHILFFPKYSAIYARCQISLLYSSMVRSEEKNPVFAIFTSIFFAQFFRSA